ncbi:ScbA/BarX family gamma-butyrolactone biosynthesis protein [Streptomyces sp. NPDC006309]|uniref:ScbA/BarX family gamma-butyrolactone biosynthesis protein n=1 Tax=Streptomyces sp. NPDC006309 TaxID=3156749 RepID=UPI00339FE990
MSVDLSEPLALTTRTTSLTGRPRPLSFEQTAPRDLVHRRAIGEVLLTDWIRLGANRFAIGAQWPRGHGFYRPVGGRWHDPLLAAESIRQTSSLVSHLFYDLPRDHPTLMTELSIDLRADALALDGHPADVELTVDCTGVTFRGGHLAGMTMDVGLARGQVPLGRGRMTLNCLRPAVYRRLRGAHAEVPDSLPEPPAPVPPHEVGRAVEADVVLGRPPADHGTQDAREGVWPLRVNWAHPTLFDHPTDHVPGMLLMEAARQAAQRLAGPGAALLPVMTNHFHSYVEFDAPCLVRARLSDGDGTRAVRVTAEQDGALVYECLLAVHGTPAPSGGASR